ncbi:hypothetical protein NP233_g7090 [Leucocoprinus birnbaumii]|uniref:Amino acid transporter n=1 Tax=Leucocoprinus birnbaumii TaxID=56174 RepID=A0AAD5VQZ3_9AGAR|nr:hypothetical protein NP233_g7090 [Leucocoprinus birnbaumii]
MARFRVEDTKPTAPGSSTTPAETESRIEDSDTGAPVETLNPLGRHVTLFAAVMLNVGQMTGSGIFTVPGSILNSVGSIGVALLYWLIAPLFAFCGLALYTELASMFPDRSGAEVVFLEKAYPRPKYFVSTVFAVTTILTSFSVTNAVVFAQYLLNGLGQPVTAEAQTRVAFGVLLISISFVAISTKFSITVVKLLSSMKVLSLIFVVVTGAAVLLGFTNIQDPYQNFRRPFEGTSFGFNAHALALVKANFSFVGWHNAFNVLAEIRSQDPVRTAKKGGALALLLTTTLFFFINVAYAAAVPIDEIKHSGQLVAALFFQRVYGSHLGGRILSYLVALSCFGNLIAVTIGHARLIREVARQGLLPYPTLLASTKPFGTPIGPVIVKGGISVLLLLLVPAKDAFNFVLNLAAYPGISSSSSYRDNGLVVAKLLTCIALVVMPWIPPEPGHSDVSFWYATHCVAAIFILLATALYYYVWIKLLPKLGSYDYVEIIEESEGGARNKRLVRRYKNPELAPLLASSV